MPEWLLLTIGITAVVIAVAGLVVMYVMAR
ncbi:MAG: hypothetical protein JWP30_442 [Homoserinimonas sp.]|jgi:hypothetical protein|nr:hypothetical protein [Homoserinimonas sp.]